MPSKKAARKVPAKKAVSRTRSAAQSHASHGHNFLASVIASGNSARLLSASREWFLEEEWPAFDAVRAHFREHRQLPAIATMRSLGHSLPETLPEPPTFYLERLQSRAIFNIINNLHPELKRAMDSRDASASIAVLRDMLTGAGGVGRRNEFTGVRHEVRGVLDDYRAAKQNMGQLMGVTLGYPFLNAMTMGIGGGELGIVVGRPGTGKTYMLVEMAYQAWLAGHSVGFVTMEMNKRQIVRRWVGRHTRINPQHLRSGQVSAFSEPDLERGVSELANSPVPVTLLSGDFNKTTGGVEELILRHDPDIVFIDAMYLMSPEARARGHISRWEQIAGVVSDIKQMLMRHDKPGIGSVQFNRNQRDKGNKSEPDLGDIGGTDSIGQDASLVIGGQRAKPPFQNSRRLWTIMKNREGDTGQFTTRFGFDPVDFSEIPLGELEDSPEGGAMDWMQ